MFSQALTWRLLRQFTMFMVRSAVAGYLLVCTCLWADSSAVTVKNSAVPTVKNIAQSKSSQHKLNFHKADIRAVIAIMAQLTHKNFIIDPRLQGRITLVSSHPMSTDEAYQAFISMLQVLNYTVVPVAGVYKVVPLVDAKGEGLPVANAQHPGHGDEMVVRIIQLHNISVESLVPILRPMLQDSSTLNAYQSSNAIIMAGPAAAITHLVHVVKKLDANDAQHIRVVPLLHANASQVQQDISKIQSTDSGNGKYIDATVVADAGTNSLLLSGSLSSQESLLNLIHRLDDKNSQNDSHAAKVVALNYLKAKEVAPLLQKMFAAKSHDGIQQHSINIIAEESTNTLLVNAPVNVLQNILHIIRQLDKKPQQVLVEAIIAEVDQSSMTNLGIEWGSVGSSSSDDSDGGISGDVSGGIASFTPGIGMLPHTSIRAVAYALESHGNSNILATPMISVINNKEAKLSDGKEISTANREYATTDTGANSSSEGVPFNTYEYKKVELSLKVTPQISPNGMVNLKIDQENDSLIPDSSSGGSDGNPSINTSNINTYVMVHSGDILVMGGLIKQDKTGNIKSVPILGRLPILGNLFKHNLKDAEKKDLLVFIRPIILKNSKTSRAITKNKYNYMRNEQYRRDTDQPLINTQHGPYLSRFPGSKVPVLPSPFVVKKPDNSALSSRSVANRQDSHFHKAKKSKSRIS